MVMLVAKNLIWLLFVWLGIRLITTGVREKSLPERFLGCGLILSGPGAGLMRQGVALQAPELTTVGIALTSVGGCFTLTFAYLTFRRDDGWARWLLAALIIAFVTGAWHQIAVVGVWRGGTAGRPSLVLMAARAVGMGWCALESVRYRRMYVKRLKLGLADPVIANRFLLYAIWTGALAFMPAIVGIASLLDDNAETWRQAFLIPVRAVGAVVFVSMVLVFLPPAAYTRFIKRRHARLHGEPAE